MIPLLRISQWIQKPPDHYGFLSLFRTTDSIPILHSLSARSQAWLLAKNHGRGITGTWGQSNLGSCSQTWPWVHRRKWVYFIKVKEDETPDCYNAWLVAQGFKHEYEIDYEEIVPLLQRWLLCTLSAIAFVKRWTLFQTDVKFPSSEPTRSCWYISSTRIWVLDEFKQAPRVGSLCHSPSPFHTKSEWSLSLHLNYISQSYLIITICWWSSSETTPYKSTNSSKHTWRAIFIWRFWELSQTFSDLRFKSSLEEFMFTSENMQKNCLH